MDQTPIFVLVSISASQRGEHKRVFIAITIFASNNNLSLCSRGIDSSGPGSFGAFPTGTVATVARAAVSVQMDYSYMP
jgi:hypothetical protein